MLSAVEKMGEPAKKKQRLTNFLNTLKGTQHKWLYMIVKVITKSK